MDAGPIYSFIPPEGVASVAPSPFQSQGNRADVTPDTEIPASQSITQLIQEQQESQMSQRAMSLMDVLAPPGNDWLRELSRRKSDLPAGVHIVRFSDVDDELTEDSEAVGRKAKHRTEMAI